MRSIPASQLHSAVMQYISSGEKKYYLQIIKYLTSLEPKYIAELSANQMSILHDTLNICFDSLQKYSNLNNYEAKNERCQSLLHLLFTVGDKNTIYKLLTVANKFGNLPVVDLFKYHQNIVTKYFDFIASHDDPEQVKESMAQQFLHQNLQGQNSFGLILLNNWTDDLDRYFDALTNAMRKNWLTPANLTDIFYWQLIGCTNLKLLKHSLQRLVLLKEEFNWNPVEIIFSQDEQGFNLLLSLIRNLKTHKELSTSENLNKTSRALLEIFKLISNLIGDEGLEKDFLKETTFNGYHYLHQAANTRFYKKISDYYLPMMKTFSEEELEIFFLQITEPSESNILHILAMSSSLKTIELFKETIFSLFSSEKAHFIWDCLLNQKNKHDFIPSSNIFPEINDFLHPTTKQDPPPHTISFASQTINSFFPSWYLEKKFERSIDSNPEKKHLEEQGPS
ncbi:MAG: hypothetical protein K2X39_08300 [Silvanigrellaceae bacterium]|nr:hypothetical protein [Silvanigrellaceae bacterium]